MAPAAAASEQCCGICNEGSPRRWEPGEFLRRRAVRRLVLRQDRGAAGNEATAAEGHETGGLRAAQSHAGGLSSKALQCCWARIQSLVHYFIHKTSSANR